MKENPLDTCIRAMGALDKKIDNGHMGTQEKLDKMQIVALLFVGACVGDINRKLDETNRLLALIAEKEETDDTAYKA